MTSVAAPLAAEAVAWGFGPDPADPAWLYRSPAPRGHFSDVFGALRVRIDGPQAARMRIDTDERHVNIGDTVHGGLILAAIDQAIFVCPSALGIERVRGGVTIGIDSQFMAPAVPGSPLDFAVEVMRATGRLLFVRGTVEQGEATVAGFSATIRRA